ncbi:MULTISPECIES: universal stress protein [unclassified Streptomyces]|uniref:universal stress protein n=1 Tax=unclassified Streptomyces TaxID=2593676 RepID=UPI002259D440|nr:MULTISPECIES: universal stress protein [unclassified Streptomyces]MCX4524398.1 universal stress protein [Streptomyces sp. NBC_01551]MCX4545080.1 universal stress protein [Streptomyces sp. NBC_01565]
MSNRITVGLDGSGAGSAAADWAADEAELRGAALELVHAEDWAQYGPFAAPLPEPRPQWAEDLLSLTRDRLLREHRTLDITTRTTKGLAASKVLASSAADADLLVLGSRGLGAVAGFIVGSTGSATIPETDTPVVLVRSTDGEDRPLGHADNAGAVVLGVDLRSNCDRLLAFACEEADRRGCPLVVVHGWSLPPVFSYAPALDPGVEKEMAEGLETTLRELLSPWERKYPQLAVDARIVIGQPAIQILDVASGAALVVVGRRIRRPALGARIGPITHAVMHHATSPVAIVAHD